MSLFLRFYPSYFSGFLVVVLRASVCRFCTKLQAEQGVAAVVKESITFTISSIISHAVSMYIDRISSTDLMNSQCLRVSYDVREICSTDLLSFILTAPVTNTTNNTTSNSSIGLQELAIR